MCSDGLMGNRTNSTGFSLVEILIVVAVIAILASMMLGVAELVNSKSKQRALKTTFALLDSALEEYYDYWDTFPDPNKVNTPPFPSRSAALYAQLNSTPPCRDIVEKISNTVISDNPDNLPEVTDPWGTVLEYLYVPDETFPKLISAGPDKDPTTIGDNITNR